VDAGHIQVIVGVGNHVAETGSANQAFGKTGFYDARTSELAESFAVALGRAETGPHAGRDSQVYDDLHGLPEMKDDGVGFDRHRPQVLWAGGQQFNDTSKVPFDGCHLFRQDSRVGAHAACKPSRICS
jgi:hypothetical protein